SLRCALSEPCATARRAVDDCDAEAPAAADRVEVPPRPAPGPASARTLEARPPFGRFAGGRTQPFRTNSLPAAPRGRHIAPGPEGRSSSRQSPRPSAPNGEADQADR